jgi:transcriptional regulator with XRE-family HTH domain
LLLQDFIRKRRNELGITQVELAKKAEFSIRVVKRFEDDKPYDPRGINLFKLARAMKVDVDTLLFEYTWPLERRERNESATKCQPYNPNSC